MANGKRKGSRYHLYDAGLLNVQQLDENNLPIRPSEQGFVKSARGNALFDLSDPSLFGEHTRMATEESGKFLTGQAMPYESEEYMKGEVQSGWSKFSRGLVSRGASIVPKMAGMIGHAAGALWFAHELGTPGMIKDPSIIWDNLLADGARVADEQLREQFPIHGKKEYYKGNILQQMGTPKFWYDDAFDAVAFSLAAYGIGAGVGAVGKGIGLAGKGLKTFQLAGATVLNTFGEAGMEADELNTNLREQIAWDRYGMSYKELPEKDMLDVKYEAATPAMNTFVANAALLAVPNLIQSRMFFGGVGKNAKKMKELVKAGKLSSKDVNVWFNAMKKVGGSMASESLLEEGPQAAFQRYETKKMSGETDVSWLEGYANEWVNNFSIPEGQKAMVLGAIVGGLYGGRAGIKEAFQERKTIAEIEDREKMLDAVLKVADVQYPDNIKSVYKTFSKTVTEKDEDGNQIEKTVETLLNKDGKTEIDVEKAMKMFYQQIGDKRIWDELLVATIKNDPIYEKTLKDEILSRRFYGYISNPLFENVDEAIEALEEREIDSVTEEDELIGIQKRMAKADIQKFKNIYDEIENKLIGIEDLTGDETFVDFKNKIKKALFYEAIKRNSYEASKLLTNKEQAKIELDKLIEDSQKITNAFLDKKQQKKLFNEYNKERNAFTDLETKITEEKKKEEPNKILIGQLEYDLKEQQAIRGLEDPNSIFALTKDEAFRHGEFGLRNEYFYKVGADAMVSGTIENMIEQVKKGEIEAKEVISYMQGNKQKITKEDVEKLQGVINIEEDKLEAQKESARVAENNIEKFLDKKTEQEVESILSGGEAAYDEDIEIKKAQDALEKASGTLTKLMARGAGKSKRALEAQKSIKENEGIINDLTKQKQVKEQKLAEDQQKVKDDQEIVRMAEENEKALNELKTFFEEFKEDTKNKSKPARFRSRIAEDRHFKRMFGDMPVQSSRNTDSNFKANPETFTNVSEVQNTINKLKEIKRIYKGEERAKLLESKEFKGFIESVDKQLIRMNEVLKVAVENLNNKVAANVNFQKNLNEVSFNSIGMSVDQKTGKWKIIDEELYNELRNTIGHKEFDAIIEEASKAKMGERDAKFYKIFADKILDKVKDTGRSDKVIDVIENKISGMVDEFKKLFLGFPTLKMLLKTGTIQNQLEFYGQNPVKQFEALVNRAKGLKTATNKVALDVYKNNKDVLQLKTSLENEPDTGHNGITKDELLSILDLQLKIENLINAVTTLESDARIGDQVMTEIELQKSEDKAPSNQQVNAIRQGVKWFNLKLGKGLKKFQEWAYMKGLAGTGKTTIVAKWMINSFGLKANEFVVVSHGNKQIKTIHDSLNPEKEGILTNELSPEKIGDEIKVIVIDEIGALDSKQLNTLGETINEINKLRKGDPVKVIVLGDPTQINKSFTTEPDINASERGQINIHELQPLTIVYRSNVSSVLDVQNKFQDNTRSVRGIVARANAPLGKSATGVHVGTTTEELKNQVKVHSKNNRTKVIIVADEKGKAKYDDMQEFADVETVIDAVGIEWDEVYVDIREGGEGAYKYNTAMYTALSRAKQYIFIFDHTNTFKNEILESEEYDKDKAKEDIKQANNEYSERLAFEAQILGKEIINKSKPTTSQMRDITDSDIEGNETPQVEDESGQGEAHSATTIKIESGEIIEAPSVDVKGVHEVEFPSYGNINYHKKGVHGGPQVQIVKYIMVYNEKAKRPEIHIVAEELNNNGQPVAGENWHLIGVVGMEDLEKSKTLRDLHDKIISKSKSDKTVYNGLNRRGQLLFKENHPSILLEGYLQASHPLTYKYSEKTTDKGVGILNRLMDKFNLGFHRRGKTTTEISVKIFKNTELFEGEKIAETHFYAGVPYLIIRTTAWKRQGEGKPVATQYIRLNPRRLMKGDRGIQELMQFRDAIKVLEEIGIGKLGQASFNSLIKRFSNNYELDGKEIVAKEIPQWTYEAYQKDEKNKQFLPDITEDQFNQLNKNIDPVIRLFYGYGKERVSFASEEEMRKYKDKKGNNSYIDTSDNKFIFEQSKTNENTGFVKEADPTDLKDKGRYIYQDALKAGEGLAQSTINLLATANPKTGDTRFRVSFSSKGVKITYGKSLLAGEDTYGQYYKELIRILRNNLPANIRTKFTIVNANNIVEAESALIEMGFATQEELNEKRKQYTIPTITSETLDQLLTFNKETDEHEELWLPLDYEDINKLGENIDLSKDNSELESKLATSFEKVNPTRIQVKLDEGKVAEIKKAAKKVVEKITKKKKNISDELDDDINARTLKKDATAGLGKRISIAQAQALAKRLVPGMDKDMIQFVDQMTLDVLHGDNVWGLFKNGVLYILKNEDGTVHENIVRHEVFHKIFNQYLTTGEQRLFMESFNKEYPQTKLMTQVEIEEEIALKFQEWRSNEKVVKSSFIRKIFNKILRYFNFLSDNSSSLDTYFNRIERGFYNDLLIPYVDITRALKNIVKVWGTLESYINARAIVESKYHKRIKSGYMGLPLTRKELYHMVLDDLNKDMTELYNRIQDNKEASEEDDELFKDVARWIEYKGLFNTMLLTNKDGKYVNFDRLVKDIYPNRSFKTRGIINPTEKLSDGEIFENWKQLGDGVIGKHTVENDQVDREAKVTESIKDFLSGIKLGKKFLNWRESYIRMLQLVEGLQPGNERFFEQLGQAWKKNGSHERTRAVLDYFIDEWELAATKQVKEGKLKGQLLPTTGKFINEDTFIYSEDGVEDVIGINEAKQKGIAIIKRGTNQSTVDYIGNISRKVDISDDVLGILLQKEMSGNTIRGLMNNFASQKEKHVKVGRSKMDNGLYKIAYIVGKALGPNSSIAATVRNALREKFKNLNTWNNVRDVEIPTLIEKYKDEPVEFVRAFLASIDLGYLAVYLPENNINTVRDDIIEFVQTHTQLVTDSDSFEKALENDGVSLVRNLAELINHNNEFIRATSIRDAEGKNKYVWSQASQAHDILFNLINRKSTSDYRGVGKFSTLSLPEHLKTKFFKNNIFVRGLNHIYSLVDHDGMRDTDWRGVEYITPYKKELNKDFLARNFVYGFLAHLKTSRKGNEKYTQYFYTIAERPNIIGAEVGVLKPEQVKAALGDMLRQIMNRDESFETTLANFKTDKLINLSILEDVLDGRDLRKKPLTEKEISGLTRRMYTELLNLSTEVTDAIIAESVNLDQDLFKITNLNKFIDSDTFSTWDMKEMNKKHEGGLRVREDGKYVLSREDLLPMIHAYVSNNYVNSYNLNQLVAGDFAQYKNGNDLLKRMALVFAPGMKGFINEDFGMRKTYKSIVIKDPVEKKENLEGFLQRLLKRKDVSKVLQKFGDYMPGDGQGFITPERFDEINRGFDNAYDLINVLKPVYFGTCSKGITRGVKYSVIVLSDDLVADHPELRNLRQNMRDEGIGEAVLDSAVKVGNPSVTVGWGDITSKTGEEFKYDENSVMELSNENFRISQNPKSSITDEIANPSQLIYFLNILGTNVESAAKAYKSLTWIIEDGLDKFEKELSVKGLKSKMMSLFNTPGQERKHEMLSEGLSVDFPAIASSVAVHLSSALTKDTVRMRFPGRVHVLQTSLGIKKPNGEELQYKEDENGNLYAEVLVTRGMLSKSYEDRIDSLWKQGKEETGIFLYNDAFGFRLPSSEMHSAVPLRVVGFYDTLDTNVVVAPKELVPLHGSDFDVDELFVISRVLNDKGDPIGYSKNKDGKLVLADQPAKDWDNKTLIGYHKNVVVEAFLEAFSAERNRERMLTSINTKFIEEDINRLNKIRKLTKKELEKEGLYLDLSNPLDNMAAHDAVFRGSESIGIFANGIKMLAYMMRAGEGQTSPKIVKDYDESSKKDKTIRIVINGVEHDQIRDYELDKDGKENKELTTWEILDGFLNSAVDNVKLMILPRLNINKNTINEFIVLKGHGVNIKTLNNIMVQPAIKFLSKEKFNGYSATKKLLLKGLGVEEVNQLELIEVNDEMLEKGMKWRKDMRDLINNHPDKITKADREFFVNQLSVLENVWSKAMALSTDMTKLSFFTNLINNMPDGVAAMDEQMEFADRVFGKELNDDGTTTEEAKVDTKFSHDISNYFKSNPHIFAAYRTLKFLRNTLRDNLLKHSPALYEFIDNMKLKNGVNIKLDNRNEGKNNELKREEFVRYLMSGFESFDDVPPWKYKDSEGQDRQLTGPKAFSQHLIQKIDKARRLLPKNLFLRNIEARFDPINKTWFLRFSGGTNLDATDLLSFQKSFMELNRLRFVWSKSTSSYIGILIDEKLADNEYSDFQREFVSYGILQFGLKFGTTNYSLVLPVDLYKKIDKQFTEKLSELVAPGNRKQLDGLLDHFTIETAINYTDQLSIKNSFDENLMPTGKTKIDGVEVNIYYGTEDGIVFDRKYDNSEGKEYPLVIRNRGYYGQEELYVRVSPANSEIIYYQKAGNKNRVTFYNLNRDIIENGYDISEAFDPGMRNVQTANNKNNRIFYRGFKVSKGNVISLTNYHDPARIDKRIVVVDKIDKNYMTVKDISRTLKAESTVEKYTNTLKTRLLKRGSPFYAPKKGKVVMINGREGEGMAFKNNINRKEFGNLKVLKQITTSYGWEVVINKEVLLDWLYGKQQTLFSSTNHLEKIENISSDEMRKEYELEQQGKIEYLKENYSTSTSVVDKALEIRDRVGLPHIRKFIDAILPVLRKYESKLEVVFSKIEGEAFAEFDPMTGTVRIDLTKVNGASEVDNLFRFDMAIAHELFHAVTTTTYMSNPAFKEKIDDMFRIAKERAEKEGKDFYGLKSQYEFLADVLKHPEFREFLSTIPYEEKNILRKIWDALKSIFVKQKSLLDVVEKFITGYDLKIYAGENEIEDLAKENPFFKQMRESYLKEEFRTLKAEVETEVEEKELTDEEKRDKLFDDIKNKSNEIILEVDENGEEVDFYTFLGKKFERITDRVKGFINQFVERKIDTEKTFGERKADMIWENIDHDIKQTTDEGDLENYDEYRDRMDLNMEIGKTKGKIIHKKIQRYIDKVFNSGRNIEQIDLDIRDIASRVGINVNDWNWVDENFLKIMKKARINTFSEGVPDELKDKLLSEVKVISEILGFGGSIDLLTQHSDGKFSITDFKTGSRFDMTPFVNLLKYGNQEIEITDNQRNRAKLQVMLYALMLKIENPNIQFRELSLTWIPNKYKIDYNDMDRAVAVNSYLPMVESFLKDKKALKQAGLSEDIYEQIIKKSPKAFWVSEYTNMTTDSIEEECMSSELTNEQLLSSKYAEMTLIKGKEQRFEDLSRIDKKRLMKLTKEIQVMSADPSMELIPEKGYDISKVMVWIGNYSDVPNPFVQIWKKYRDRRRHQVRNEALSKDLKMKALLEPIVEEYKKKKFTVRALGVSDINYKELYAPFYTYFTQEGRNIKRLVISTDDEYKQLSEAQKKYLDFINAEFKSWFVGSDAFMNQIARYKTDPISGEERGVTFMELINQNRAKNEAFEYYEGWFPKAIKTMEEIRYDLGKGSNIVGALTPEYMKEVSKRKLTRYIEDTYQGWSANSNEEVEALPVNHLGSLKIDSAEEYTDNLEYSYDSFVREMTYKKYMDSVYASRKSFRTLVANAERWRRATYV